MRLRDSNGATARFLTARMSSSASHMQVPGPRAQLQVRKLASTAIPTGADGDDHAAGEGAACFPCTQNNCQRTDQ